MPRTRGRGGGVLRLVRPGKECGQVRQDHRLERIAFLSICQAKELHAAAARLYTDVFAADPTLADDVAGGHRYRAARAAHAAGCGRGTDAAGLAEAGRARWRRQAREWLRADLTLWRQKLDGASPQERARVAAAGPHGGHRQATRYQPAIP